jgi:hypothetical protein
VKSLLRSFRHKANLYDYRCQLSDIEAMATFQSLGLHYLPWSAASFSPTALRLILNDIIMNRRRTFLELGTGVSTILLARVAKDKGCSLYSVDHDASWLEVVEGLLRTNGLDDNVTLIHAPMARFPGADENWYDTSKLESVREVKLDSLIVDGPLAGDVGQPKARAFALPWFQSQLNEVHSVFLDDVGRDGEKECIREWEQDYGYAFDCDFLNRGVGYAMKGNHYVIK